MCQARGYTAKMKTPVNALFTDIGGVLLTNGWDRAARAAACQHFGLDAAELNERHHLSYTIYEEGKLTLDDYLERTVFHEPRSFTPAAFRAFMFDRSQRLPGMLELLAALKAEHDLKVVAVSNEGRELTEHRVRAFDLSSVIETFVSSCFVHVRKPDAEIFRIALDVAQVDADAVVYLDDRPMFVEVARGLGVRGVVHTSYEDSKRHLAELGLAVTV